MDADNTIDRLVILIVAAIQSGELMHHLSQNAYYFTKIDSMHGFLQESTVCLLVGLNQASLERLLNLIRQYCRTHRTFVPASMEMPPFQNPPMMIEAETGGAIIYTLDVEQFVQF
jgi:uncharacterized protein YaaQ